MLSFIGEAILVDIPFKKELYFRHKTGANNNTIRLATRRAKKLKERLL